MLKKKIRAMAYIPWWKVRSVKRVQENMQKFNEMFDKEFYGYKVSKAVYGDVIVCAFDLIVFGNRFNINKRFDKVIDALEESFGHKVQVEIELEVD